MADIAAIIKFLDNYLEKENKDSIIPPDANVELGKAGILEDDKDPIKSGRPLRRLLKKGDLPHAFKVGKYWFIPHSKKQL